MSASSSRAGTMIADRFRVSRHHTDTPFGARWFARDQKTRKQVEVLFVRPDLVRGREQHFHLAAANVLDHPHAVTVLHQSLVPEPVRVTEWEKHLPLLERLDDPLLLSIMVGWMAEVAGALAAGHEQQMMHGSVSPASIWILPRRGPHGTARLACWGMVNLLDGLDPTNSTGITNIGGTAWMSPEYASGLPLTSASDVYALGTVLYHCATGDPPFTGPSMKVAAAHVTELAPPPSLRAAGVPPWMDELVLQMLQKDPNQRPGAVEVQQRLIEGGAMLIDQAVQDDKVTANAAPSRLPRVAMRGAHANNPLPKLDPIERPTTTTDDAHLMGILSLVVVVLLILIIGMGFWMRQ